MEYIVSLSSQTRNFLVSLGFGLLLGIAYDLIRTIRLIISSSTKSLYVSDFLFVIFSGFATFLFCLTITNGEIRWYVLFGELLGFLVYYFSFGIIVIHFTDKIVTGVRKFFFKAVSLILKPIRKLFDAFKKFFSKFAEKMHKKTKKTVKKSKFHLQINKALLYNLSDRMRLFYKKPKNSKEK